MKLNLLTIIDKQVYQILEGKSLDNIISDNQLFFNEIKMENISDYLKDPDKKLEKDEWFYLDVLDSEIKEFFSLFLTTTGDNICKMQEKEKFKQIKFIYSNISKDVVNIQLIDVFARLKYKSIIYFHETKVDYSNLSDEFAVSDKINIVIDKNYRVYFKKIEDLIKINDGFIDYYKEASDEEINDFIDQVVKNIPMCIIDKNISKIGVRNKKNIYRILKDNKIKLFYDKEEIVRNYIDEYIKGKLTEKDGKIIIKSNAEMTLFLNIINEKYYCGYITNDKFLANSNELID